jgi:glycosyltransferase involved in cell wall biosynthesis
MDSDPLVSVLIPAYNAADTLRRAVDSILHGTYHHLELIVVDDGSSDGTTTTLSDCHDDRLRRVRQEHTGVAAAMNRGVNEARASLIARMDADDFSHPERLRRQVHHLLTNRLDIVGGQVRILDAAGQAVTSMQRYEAWVNSCRQPDEIMAYRFVESPLVNPTVLARAEVFTLGCREGDFPEDYDLWLRALQAGYRAGKVSEVVLDWTDGATRLTRSDSRYSLAAFNRCRREHLFRGPLQGGTVCNLWGAGETGKQWLRWLQSEGFHIDFVVDVSPRKIGKQIHGVEVITHESLPPGGKTPLLIAVGAAGAREKIEPFLRERNYTPGQNAWFVA